MCFQLMDDVIDVLSDSETLGKPAGLTSFRESGPSRSSMPFSSARRSRVKDRLLAVLGKGETVDPEALADGLAAALAELSVDYAKKHG